MKSRKFVTGFAMLALSVLVLGACSSDDKKSDSSSESTAASSAVSSDSSATAESSEAKVVAGGPLQDGTYKLEEKNYSNDYRAVFSITVKDGKITKSEYDNINKDGKSKQEDADYNDMMKSKAGTNPEEFIPKFNEALEAAQSPANIEVVTGATHSFESFQNYAQQLIQAAQAGNTETIEIDNGAELKDGTYTLEEKNYSNDYRAKFVMTVEGGKVTKSEYDNINKDGKSKQEDADYNKMMDEKAGNSPEKFIPELNDNFVKAMNGEEPSPANIEVVTGATHSSHSFIIYAEQLVNAAEKGDTTAIEVDNIVTE
ncbi:FMN-binding protein [Enterococcus sp. JM4C]|uniref:extracellular electron transfer flavoprotein PplA n=1 Tax=Candidatus Enterococcus huntleyi TaxID=1857217 RepID=UPI00137AFF8B|nr:extracellular electron transfer flavoprotein PplA [Enterococcus sp. JM4C]KAF1297966.1 FMN-binding protein [Enterococcus sp. JM4C]